MKFRHHLSILAAVAVPWAMTSCGDDQRELTSEGEEIFGGDGAVETETQAAFPDPEDMPNAEAGRRVGDNPGAGDNAQPTDPLRESSPEPGQAGGALTRDPNEKSPPPEQPNDPQPPEEDATPQAPEAIETPAEPGQAPAQQDAPQVDPRNLPPPVDPAEAESALETEAEDPEENTEP